MATDKLFEGTPEQRHFAKTCGYREILSILSLTAPGGTQYHEALLLRYRGKWRIWV